MGHKISVCQGATGLENRYICFEKEYTFKACIDVTALCNESNSDWNLPVTGGFSL